MRISTACARASIGVRSSSARWPTSPPCLPRASLLSPPSIPPCTRPRSVGWFGLLRSPPVGAARALLYGSAATARRAVSRAARSTTRPLVGANGPLTSAQQRGFRSLGFSTRLLAQVVGAAQAMSMPMALVSYHASPSSRSSLPVSSIVGVVALVCGLAAVAFGVAVRFRLWTKHSLQCSATSYMRVCTLTHARSRARTRT